MESSKIKEVIKKKLAIKEEESQGKSQSTQANLLEETLSEGHNAFLSGNFIEDNPHEEDSYLFEAWEDGWTGAYDSMVLSTVVVSAKRLVEGSTSEEIDFYFTELRDACSALNPQIFEEFNSFFSEFSNPDEETLLEE